MLTLEWASTSRVSQAFISAVPLCLALPPLLGMSVSSSGKVPLGAAHPLPGVAPGTVRRLVTGSELEWTGAPATPRTRPSPVLAECPLASRTQQVGPFIQQGVISHPVHVGHRLHAGSAAWAPVQPLPEEGLQPGGSAGHEQEDCGEQKGDKGSTRRFGRSQATLEPQTGPRKRPAALSTFLCCFPAGPVPAARPRVKPETSWTSSSRR